ncbi:MAG: hypothetical protein ACE37B_24030 [Ilumatobacter sp.]|jgi:hypothetical protein|uniref:hypothetical protein n=1 Tax=Ilumatobacter sp. TaxID=1967498 RepID=UPI00391B12AF
MPACFRTLAIVVAMIGATGCVGATERGDFDREIQRRGGGVTNEWLAESLDALADEVGADDARDVRVMSLNANPGTRSMTALAQRNDRPDDVDTVSIRDREVTSTTPVPDVDELVLDDVTVRLGELPLDRIEDLADRALAAFDADGAYVERISIAVRAQTPTITLRISSERDTGGVVFDAAGELIEVER